jgi:hypothetical protein
MGRRMRYFVDKMIIDGPAKRTAEGYLVCSPRIARTGIQEYTAAELGLKDGDLSRTMRVYRSEDEVFHVDALKSMAYRPITIEHPRELVTADNWKQLAKGLSGGDVVRDGEFIRVPMTIMDRDAVNDAEHDRPELSVGYLAELDFTPGTTPAGEHFDAQQRNIRGNHIAITQRARGGSQLRVIDSTHPREETAMKKILVDGIEVTVEDSTAQIIARFIQTRDAEKEKSEEELKKEKEKADKFEKDSLQKDAQIVTLTQQLADASMTPAKLDAAVKARGLVVDAARKVLPSVVVDGKTEAEIQRQVVDARLGDAAKGWSAEMVAASFNTLSAGNVVVDTVRNFHQTHSNQTVQGTAEAAHATMVTGLSDAWKTPANGAK